MPNNTIIQLKRSATTGVAPTNLLANGELAVNLVDKRIFTTDTTGGAVFDAMQNTASNLSITGTSVQLLIGNSTVNSVSNSSFHRVQNSTVSTSMSIANIVTTNVYASFYSTGNIASMSQLGSGANSTNFLRGDGTFAVPTTGSASPAGANTQVQYNDSGTTGGAAGLTFNKTSNVVTVSNNLIVSQKLNVGSGVGYDFGTTALVELDATQNTYAQVVIQNANTGTNASGDLVLTADSGNDSVNYLDIGINSSLYSNSTYSISGALDAYMYSSNSHLVLGTATAKEIIFHANGTTSADRKMAINATAITVNNIPLYVSNSTTNATLTPALLTIGNSTTYGSFSNTTMLIASNSTVNSIITDATITVQNSTANAILTPIGLTVSLGNTSGGDIATPTTNSLIFFAKTKGGRMMGSMIGPSGFGGVPFMPHIMHNPTSWLLPTPGGTTITALRATSANTIAFTGRTPTTANAFLSAYRVGQTTGASAGSSVSWRNTITQWWRGNASGLGGFYAVARFGVAASTTNGRAFIGFKDSATILTNANPSGQTNIIGVGWDSGQTTLRAISANSTAANTIDLGSGFPTNTGNTDWYEVVLFAPPNGGTAQYQVTNLKNGNNVIGSFNQTNLPSTTTLLTWQFWGNNGSDSAALIMDWGGFTIETAL